MDVTDVVAEEPVLVHRLTWIGPSPAFSLRQVAEVIVADDADDFVLEAGWQGSDFFVIGPLEHGLPVPDLLRLIRKRSQAGVVVLGQGSAPIASLLRAGADFVLPGDAGADDVQAAIEAVQRRVHPPGATNAPWTFAAASSRLLTPEGYEIDLSEAEQQVIASFALASGEPVSREQLMHRVWGQSAARCSDNALQAVMYRLRRRIQQSGAAFAPIQSVAKVGYRFCAPLATEPAAAEPSSDLIQRHHVRLQGPAAASPPLVFIHGYACDQGVWDGTIRALGPQRRTLSYDLAGHGGSSPRTYSVGRHATLDGHAKDLIQICSAADLDQPVLVGHSVGASIGLLAAVRLPQHFKALVLVTPSASYVNDATYEGGFERDELLALLKEMDADYLPWARRLAPELMAAPRSHALSKSLTERFCRCDPSVAQHFGRVSFLTDQRALLPLVQLPTLIIQCRDDPLVPRAVGDYMHAAMPQSKLVRLDVPGHCPHLSAPDQVKIAIDDFCASLG
ncbi:alpha/beta fold hydrolase [Roseateles sp. DC23W]|uniref:Alpha/beta fold hydrolase n=1 Tax=Pelomonas dachongensis TaxID=3299029 RepID=A0ABW7EMK5_9BURK